MKTRVLFVTLITIVMLLAIGAGLTAAAPHPGDPDPARVSSWSPVYTLFSENNITTTATRNSASPKVIAGIDASNFLQSGGAYASADVFVNVDISGTLTTYITPQLSIDAVNWVNADYTYVATGTLTTSTYGVSLAADGTKYYRLPLAGKYLRFQLDAAATANNSYTPTIKMVYKNTN